LDLRRDSADTFNPGKKIVQDGRQITLRTPTEHFQFVDFRDAISIVATPIFARKP
jgi:hypothetical protein